ncbi:MAG: cobalamin biosynthesis protein [Clostridia bacterium]|nr:cobalamin biosynthesis protein [Clostridia bacterium]
MWFFSDLPVETDDRLRGIPLRPQYPCGNTPVGAGAETWQRGDGSQLGGRSGIPWEVVGCLASIDVKRYEPAVLKLAERNEWKLHFFYADELEQVEGDFESSEFVKRTVNAGNVCAKPRWLPQAAKNCFCRGRRGGVSRWR